MRVLSEHACYGGTQRFLAHESRACGTEMRLAVYEPPQAEQGRVPESCSNFAHEQDCAYRLV